MPLRWLGRINLRHWPLLVVATVAAIFALDLLVRVDDTHPVSSYQDCITAGYPVLDTEPPICRAGNQSFTGPATASAAPLPPATSAAFDLLIEGDSHGRYPRRQEVIRTSADWQRYWREVHAGLSSQPPLVPVDFSNKTVIALSEGQQATSGYSLRVGSIMTSQTGTVVEVLESVPTITCVVAQGTTNRYAVVETSAQLPEPVTFRITTTRRRC